MRGLHKAYTTLLEEYSRKKFEVAKIKLVTGRLNDIDTSVCLDTQDGLHLCKTCIGGREMLYLHCPRIGLYYSSYNISNTGVCHVYNYSELHDTISSIKERCCEKFLIDSYFSLSIYYVSHYIIGLVHGEIVFMICISGISNLVQDISSSLCDNSLIEFTISCSNSITHKFWLNVENYEVLSNPF